MLYGIFCLIKFFSESPVVAIVKSKILTIAVLMDPLYSWLLLLIILVAQILPCLLAGPAR